MREIKFRAWDNHYKYMNYKVIVGVYGEWEKVKDDKDYTSCSMWIEPQNVDYKCEPHWTSFEPYHEDIKLMQFTGLYDKNKVPIYEGDIVKIPEWMGYSDEKICLCIYNQENNTSPVIGFGLYTKSKLTGRYQDLVESDEWDECEVIGNIYDNKDLLGE